MRTAFVAGLLLGLASVLAAARFFPWVELARLPSQTTVVANGGRAEQLVIRLPADRIAGSGSADAGMRAVAWPEAAALDVALLARPMLVEHFKVRDRSGAVIGIAARHWTEGGSGGGTAWLIVLPGRGALMLTAAGDGPSAVDRALRAQGHRAGQSWTGELEIVAADGEGSARMRAGAQEFEGLEGRYTEVWRLTGVSPAGELKGTIELTTLLGTSPAAGGQPR